MSTWAPFTLFFAVFDPFLARKFFAARAPRGGLAGHRFRQLSGAGPLANLHRSQTRRKHDIVGMRCLSASAAILTVVAGVFFLIQGLPACPNGSAPQDLPLPPPPPPPPKALLLALGVITAPGHFNRRVWMRQKLRVTEARRRGVRVLFVLGSQNHMNGKQRKAVRHEERAHRDVIFVPARDYLPHAVAEKSLGWWLYAASNLQAKWIGKTDDDSLTYLPRLVCPCHSNLPMQPPRQVTEA